VPAQELGDPVSFDYANITIEVAWCDAATKEKYPMRLEKWEVTIQNIIDECNHDEKGSDRIFMAWRAKLEKEPTLLRPFQIDEIVRAVRGRLSNDSRWHKAAEMKTSLAKMWFWVKAAPASPERPVLLISNSW
jgi:hypothetical protein